MHNDLQCYNELQWATMHNDLQWDNELQWATITMTYNATIKVHSNTILLLILYNVIHLILQW